MGTRAIPPREPPPAPPPVMFGPRRPSSRRREGGPTPDRDPIDFDIGPPDLGPWAYPIYTCLAIVCVLLWIPLGAVLWAFGRWCAQTVGLA